ncbi:hypothetical protein BPAE_0031g00660 [Botrytis paeoniae]|uniref:Uncharacterized protein n=1 Tax=Botrytis paeoniae TaxID=278948 RepID=A0A4Z1FY36_9HELO|nr:hypothetical protein BPAE_0031g00660 [Botrytis paeoniae]
MASLKQAKDELVRTLEILEQKLQLSKASKKQEALTEKIVDISKGGIYWEQGNLSKKSYDRCENSNLPSNLDSGLDYIEGMCRDSYLSQNTHQKRLQSSQDWGCILVNIGWGGIRSEDKETLNWRLEQNLWEDQGVDVGLDILA